ncbi:MAG: hypothetical protein GXP09_12870 [Gammaproteobacteria bacterium]|nr:hypothetical protein [Gammaproteobacteria bacterium]
MSYKNDPRPTGFWLIWPLLALFFIGSSASAAITALELVIQTGNDDLRGGNDNVNASILLRNGSQLRFDNINKSKRWANGSQHTVRLNLNLMVDRNIESRDDVVGLRLQSTFRGGIDGDNWKMRYLKVTPIDSTVGGGGRLEPYYERRGRSGGRDLWHFTGLNRPFVARWGGRPGELSHIRLVIRTGNDDLRGGNDNLNVRILSRGGEQYVRNINKSRNWSNGSSNAVRIALDRSINLTDLLGIVLETSSRGGLGGDNWEMTYLKVTPQMLGRESYRVCYENSGLPLKRFTGENRLFQVRCR